MAEQEFVIVPPSDTDVSAMALRTDMQFLDPYGSESINRKFFGIVPPGIYRGFKYALPGAMKLRIGLPNEPGTAVVQCNSVCITVQQTKPVDLTVAAGFSGLVVLTGFYQFGVPTKQVSTTSTQDAAKIELIAASALKPNQVILYTVNVPAGTTALTAAMITTARRQDVSIAVEADIYQMLTDHIGSPTAHTKAQVGLGNVQNWPATAAVNDASDAKYATAGAVKKAYDLAAAALPKAGGTVGAIKVQATNTHLTLAGPKGENPWHFEVNAANGELKVVETGAGSRFSLAKGGAATFASHVTATQAYVSAAQSTAANALTRRDFVLKWSEDNSRLDALKQAGVYIGGATKTDFNQLDVGSHGLYSSGPDGDKSVNRPPAEAWGGSWVGLEAQRTFNSDMLQTTLPFGDAKTVSFRTRRTNAFGEWISFYSTAFKPTKDDVGLPLVNNWPASSAINDPSNAKYATAGAVKTTYDFVAKLKADLAYQLNTEYRLTINRPGELNYPYITLNKSQLRVGHTESYGVGAIQFNAGALSAPNNPDSGKSVASVFGMIDKTNEFGELLFRTKRLSNNSDTTWLKLNQDGLTLRSGGKEFRVGQDGALTASNQITTINPKDANALFSLCFINDVATVRYGGTGAGSSNGFQVAGVGDDVKFSVGHDKTVTIYNKLYGGNFTGANKQILNHNAGGAVFLGNPELTAVNIEAAGGVVNANVGGVLHRIYHKGYNPTKTDVGLPLVNNWGATAAVNDASDVKYATAGAVKKAYDLAASKLASDANAVSATKLATARQINGTNFDGTANITTANWGTARTLTIGKAGKSVNGAANVAWTLDEIGAAPSGFGIGESAQQKDPNTLHVGGLWRDTVSTLAGITLPYDGSPSSRAIGVTSNGGLRAAARTGSSPYVWKRIYSEVDKPSSDDVGLGSVNNWPATAAVNDASDVKYATAGAVKKAYDLAASKLAANANAVSATKLATARQINGTNFDGTANITTANWGTARTLTIGNTGKSVNGAGNVAWSLDDIGAIPAIAKNIAASVDLNTLETTDFYSLYKGSGVVFTNAPPDFDYGTLQVIGRGKATYSFATQILTWRTDGRQMIRTRNDGTMAWTPWKKIYSESQKPAKEDVGLPLVNNWPATAAVNDASDAKYATAGAVKKAYDLAAAALPKAGGIVTGVVRFTGANGGISVHPTGDVTGIYNGTGDGASQDKTNLQIKSWYGIGICPTAGSSLAEGLNSIWLNARNGQISTIGEIYAQTDKKVFHQGFTPTSAEVGLGSVQNWPATAAVNDASDAKYATAGAVKKAYDLAAKKLDATANAVSATKLATARQINGTAFDGTANIVTANWGTARTLTIGKSGKSVNGAGNVAWSLAEIGAAADDHNHPGSLINPIDLASSDLDTILAPGHYSQNANANTSAARHYPENNAGSLTVTAGAGTQQRYHVYNSSRVWTRSKYNTDAWTPWARDYNTLNKPTAADVGLGNVVNKGWNHGPVGDTYAVRDGSADIQVRLLRANYQNESGMSGAIAFRINNSTDNYTRYCSNPAAVRAWLGVPATSHAHTAAQGNSDIVAGGYGQVGTYVLASNVTGVTKGIGGTVPGSSLVPASAGDRHQDGASLPGTWKCLGYSFGSGGNFDARITLWIRIA